jgi:NAD/NADP transhydrogenase alpha subunit
MLHTPLMSGANAVHGVIVVGGFVVTDRMLEMFRKRPGDR